MANKKLMIGEVEKLKATMHTTIAEAIQSFESETGMVIDYISLTRKRDRVGTDRPLEAFNEDRGPVVDVNANTSMEF